MEDTLSKRWIDGDWKTESYFDAKVKSFNLVDEFLKSPPKNILDIGCGLAFESEMLQKKYNSDLYLLDGDFETTKDRERDRKFGDSESLRFYTKLDDLRQSFDSRNLRYTLVDANDIKIESDVVFDLVYSNVSCGYHYPLTTYLELLKAHTNKDSLLIFDIHSAYLQDQIKDHFEVVEYKSMLGKKILKCSIKLK
jgi:SAM-dependent methyltransferase